MTKDSFSKRYFFKLLTNLVGFFMGIISQAIIPRSLGPGSYGDFSFLTNFFTQVVGFFDMGTLNCFYTKLSQRPKEHKLVVFYAYFLSLACLCVIIFLGAVRLSGMHVKLWPDEKMGYVYMAVFVSLLTWVVGVLNQMTDAYGLTVMAETGKALQKFAVLIILVLLFLSASLNLFTYFLYNYISLLSLMLVFLVVIRKHASDPFKEARLSFSKTRDYIHEFYGYTHPLVTYSLVIVVVGLLDRWLLQIFGGNIQQGFFGLSDQIGLACFVFTAAMTPLIMREFSVTYANQDIKAMKEIFRRNIPLLYSITAFISCFIAVNADKVTLIMGGGKFRGAVIPVALMALYPMIRTYGQLSASVFFAAGKTRLYRNIGISVMLVGIPVSYFLLAPKRFFGLEAGATGLALKTLITGFVGVNAQLYFNSKFLDLSFGRYVAHQVLSVIILLLTAWVATFTVSYLPLSVGNLTVISKFLVSGIFYTIIVAFTVYFFPVVFGLRQNDLARVKNFIKLPIKKKEER